MANLINNIYRSTDGKISLLIKNLPIENLVFEGGGPKGLVYIGAIKYLEEKGVAQKIKKVGGSSAGAMTALAIGLGYNAEQTKEIIEGTTFSTFLDISDKVSPSLLSQLKDGYKNLSSSGQNAGRGLFVGDNLLSWAKLVIAQRFEGNKYASIRKEIHEKGITFEKLKEYGQSFPEIGIKDICFTGTNYTDQTLEVFDCYKTPKMPVDLAVRISMSLPWFFQTVKYNNKEYMDGGCLNNYPMFIFNEAPYFEPGMNKVLTGNEGIYSQNLCTLGLKVDSHKEIQTILWDGAKKNSKSWLGKLWENLKNKAINYAAGTNVTGASEWIDLDTYKMYPQRTIQIFDQNQSTWDFNLEPDQKKKLIEAGYKATQDWWKLYYDGSGVQIDIPSRNQLNEFYRLNNISQEEQARIERDYKDVLSTLK